MGRLLYFRFCLLSALTPYLIGCSRLPFQPGTVARDNLANRGPVLISKANPYIASNILLAKEIEINSTLKGFVKVRGTPEALEVKKVLLRPYMMYFFYPSDKELYILEESGGDWVIRGPQQIPELLLQSLPKLTAGGVDSITSPLEVATSSDEIELNNTSIQGGGPSEIDDNHALLPAAKDDAIGDILHVVKYKGETLNLISEWYTGSKDTAQRIARINSLKDANTLSMAQKIRIPRYLVKNDKTLSKSRVEAYAQSKAHK